MIEDIGDSLSLATSGTNKTLPWMLSQRYLQLGNI